MAITDHYDHINGIVNKARQPREEIAHCDELLVSVRAHRGAVHPVSVAGKSISVPTPALIECLTKARSVAVTQLEQAMNTAPKEQETPTERPKRK